MKTAGVWYCDFCGKSQEEVRQIIAREEDPLPSVAMCDECLALSIEIIEQHTGFAHISRSLTFTPEYQQAGMNLLGYFSTVVKQKYPCTQVRVRIEQEDRNVRLVVTTPKGEIQKIEATLDDYALVIREDIRPEDLQLDPLETLQLKQKLDMTRLELQMTKEFAQLSSEQKEDRIESLERHVQELHRIVGSSLKGSEHLQDILTTVVETTYNDVARSALNIIIERVESGISLNDEEAIKHELRRIKENDPSVLKKLLQMSKEVVSGAGENLLAQWIASISFAGILPR